MWLIFRYYFTGPQKGYREIFADNLPGYPDNIRLSNTGTVYVPMGGVRHPDMSSYIEILGPYPWLRRMVMQVVIEK
jgi:adipocyte plasma membrane-associated protein